MSSVSSFHVTAITPFGASFLWGQACQWQPQEKGGGGRGHACVLTFYPGRGTPLTCWWLAGTLLGERAIAQKRGPGTPSAPMLLDWLLCMLGC